MDTSCRDYRYRLPFQNHRRIIVNFLRKNDGIAPLACYSGCSHIEINPHLPSAPGPAAFLMPLSQHFAHLEQELLGIERLRDKIEALI